MEVEKLIVDSNRIIDALFPLVGGADWQRLADVKTIFHQATSLYKTTTFPSSLVKGTILNTHKMST
jgi:hypothetical protein